MVRHACQVSLRQAPLRRLGDPGSLFFEALCRHQQPTTIKPPSCTFSCNSPPSAIMDSMRHLSTSLPTTQRRQDQPELLTDFRAAALSVTNLYKTAAASLDKARAAGYQDALDDLLAFLDKENLGLMDGEGWSVRQWATERLADDGVPKPAGSDDDEETTQEDQRGVSPVVQRKAPTIPISSSELTEDSSQRRTAVSEPPQTPLPPPSTLTHTVPSMDDFTFRSTHAPYPSNHDRDVNQLSMDLDTTSSTPTSGESFRIISRPVRGRHTYHNRQRVNGASTINFNLGAGAGSKRKLPYSDFFDISGFCGFDGRDGKDGGGGGRGGKRGRHV